MSISTIGSGSYQTVNNLLPTVNAASTDTVSSTGTTATAVSGSNASSSLSAAIAQSLAQFNSGLDVSSLLSATGQQSSSDFLSSLYSALPGLSDSSQTSNPLSSLLNGGNAPAPVQLDQNSATIKLQTSIQQLISNLNGGSSLTGGLSSNSTGTDIGNLQQSFNSLIQSSGGNPDQASLQSFLKLVAANIQGSSAVGSLFSTSA
ncbi:hypothetical protein [Undibacterium oligocarboniphilum]|uniref:Uncharacterized protein n=1 Tax=Undibacterium oligocarboniphilum TaxID=666702 RepID=A0A850QKM7_9BURK|nr:hypothetical protein [Undibacterium oligocarboniphilum]MBC3869565.1 hypothetical protein [Undibacterium oligocarboniphilum]NVO77943.1 hypothetical protein [Undibacterium oligocarboniphilum]